MNRTLQFFSSLPEHPWTRPVVLAISILLLFGANLPWHLDNYDQAKQAFVSFEIVETGEWLFQHTPQGKSASKPPLLGWSSAGLYHATGSWDLAWRLPGFLCALGVLFFLIRQGDRVAVPYGGTLAGAAFALTFLTPRIASLVRTDMALAATIFFAGWMIYRRMEERSPWTSSSRWLFALIMTLSLFLKGPLIYAFLIPGMILFLCTPQPRETRHLVWSGFWPWLLPLGLFLIWAFVGIATRENFYRDVVEAEFLSRFLPEGKPSETSQPFWFYFPHLLHKFLPWTVLALGLPIFFPAVRRYARANPGAWWLVCWTLGGILFMTLIPSKRVDRIYPVFLPAALLLPHLLLPVWKDFRIRAAVGACLLAALGIWGGYYSWLVWDGYRGGNKDLIELREEVQQVLRGQENSSLGILTARDEGILIYFGDTRFLGTSAAAEALLGGKVRFVLAPGRRVPDLEERTGKLEQVFSKTVRRKNEKGYLLLKLPDS